MRAVIEAANATGNFILSAVSFLPEELVVIVAMGLVGWMWFQNFRAWIDTQRQRRRALQCRECRERDEGDESTVELKED